MRSDIRLIPSNTPIRIRKLLIRDSSTPSHDWSRRGIGRDEGGDEERVVEVTDEGDEADDGENVFDETWTLAIAQHQSVRRGVFVPARGDGVGDRRRAREERVEQATQ